MFIRAPPYRGRGFCVRFCFCIFAFKFASCPMYTDLYFNRCLKVTREMWEEDFGTLATLQAYTDLTEHVLSFEPHGAMTQKELVTFMRPDVLKHSNKKTHLSPTFIFMFWSTARKKTNKKRHLSSAFIRETQQETIPTSSSHVLMCQSELQAQKWSSPSSQGSQQEVWLH